MEKQTVLILNKLAAVCSKKEKCSSEAFDYMMKHGCESQEEAFEAVEYLKNNKYIDDERFTRIFLSDKLRFNKWGKNKIANALRLKKIPQDIISRVFEEFYNLEDEKTILQSELAKKLRGLKKDKSKSQIWQSLMRFCISRGYSIELSNSIIRELTKDI